MGLGKVVFFGNERLANAVEESGIILSSLLEAGYSVTHLVLNRHDRQSRKEHQDKVASIAEAHDIPIIETWEESQIIEIAKTAEVGVLAAFGRIIHSDIINAFPHGIVNIHPSLLPEFRGPTPIETAIIGGSKKTGVSLMALAEKMDAGNVYAQVEQPLSNTESKQALYDALSKKGARLLIEELPRIISGENTGTSQDDAAATFTKLIVKSDGDINWNLSAAYLERQVRAYIGWPGSRTQIAGIEVTITQARLLDEDHPTGEFHIANKEIVFGCHEDSLVIERLKPDGRKEMSAEAFIAGARLT